MNKAKIKNALSYVHVVEGRGTARVVAALEAIRIFSLSQAELGVLISALNISRDELPDAIAIG